jgi:hypothetical protein
MTLLFPETATQAPWRHGRRTGGASPRIQGSRCDHWLKSRPNNVLSVTSHPPQSFAQSDSQTAIICLNVSFGLSQISESEMFRQTVTSRNRRIGEGRAVRRDFCVELPLDDCVET